MKQVTEELIESGLRDAREGELSTSEFARLLLAYQDWHLQCVEGPDGLLPVTEREEGERDVLHIYTSRAKAAEDLIYLGKEREISRLGTLSGARLIARLPDSAATLRINRGHPSMIYYERDSLELLRQLCKAMAVEELLQRLAQSNRADERRPLLHGILDYENYYILLEKVEEDYILLYAPDPQERALAAVFTAEDALVRFEEALLKEVQDQNEFEYLKNESFRRVRMSGHELFLRLQGQGLDGLVFNALGPPKPVAFHSNFLNFFQAKG